MSLKINGSTSGSVTLDAPATGSDVSFTLPGSVGTSGQLLSTNGSGVLSFVNGGKILQVVRATDSTNRTTTSGTFVDVTGMSVTITPQKSDSAILVLATFDAGMSTTDVTIYFSITDSSNNSLSGAESCAVGCVSRIIQIPLHIVGRATPATTSAVTYKLRFRASSGTATVYNSEQTGQLYAIEVAA